MYKRKTYTLIITAIVIIILVVLSIFTPFLKILSSWTGNIISPIQQGVTTSVNGIKGVFSGFGNSKKLAEENKKLKIQIDELTGKNREYLAYKNENDKFRELLDLKNELDGLNPVAATVISKDAGNWFNVFSINKGANGNIKENQPVVGPKGLIGRISQTGENWAKVVTVIDCDHSVSGTVTRTGDLVQIDGDLELMKSGLCKMTIVAEDADVVVGDTVFTSGIGGIYPKGIFIGTVVEFRANSDGTGKYAVVKPDVDFQHIYDVLVLTNGEE